MFKRIFCTLLAVVTAAFCLTSCDTSESIEHLLTAPRAQGELYDIQQALYAYAGRSIKLHYPHSGENNTAFIRSDLDGDKVDEAVAFYSVANADGVADIHINIIDIVEDGWLSVCDTATGASAIDKVEIAPLSADGVPVIAVGAELFSSTANQISLFTYIKGKLYTRMKENYTRFEFCDLASLGHEQLVILNVNAAERNAEVQIYSVGNDFNTLLGAVEVDGNISSVTAFQIGKLTDGRPALFIDSAKSAASMITDMVYFDKGKPISRYYDVDIGETQSTMRFNTLLCTDIDGDGAIDVPFAQLLPGYDSMNSDERLYLTMWRNFDGTNHKDVLLADFNYDDGYYFAIPDGWRDNVTLIYDKDTSMHSYRLWSYEQGAAQSELLRIRRYSAAEFDELDDDQRIELMRNDTQVWAARIIMTEGDYAIDKEEAVDCFGKGVRE